MKTTVIPPPDMVGCPLIFTGYEVAELFDEKGRFRLGALRERQAEKALQIILSDYHDVAAKWPDEVHRHVTPISFSLVKARRTRWGYYLMTIVYRYREVTWKHVFRFVRSSNGGLGGHLYFNSRRRIPAK